MRPSIHAVLLLAAAAASPLGAGCSVHEEPPIVTPRRLINPPMARDPMPLPPYPMREIQFTARQENRSADAPAESGIRIDDLPAVKQAVAAAEPWQQAEIRAEEKIDAPDLRQNLREGLSVLAPRLARGLMDYRGDIAVVTIAVYRDTRPAAPSTQRTNPETQPAAPTTQPVYRHAAVAIAFEGFGRKLDGSFIPRLLADQPRTPDDGREPIDPNLALDKDATSYMVFQLGKEGLTASVVGHEVLRKQLADAVATQGPTTRTASDGLRVDERPQGNLILPPGTSYDSGAPWDGPRSTYVDDRYVYAQPDQYWGYGYDPYLYDLYSCRWGSGYFITRSGYWDGGNRRGGHTWHRPDRPPQPGQPGNPGTPSTPGTAAGNSRRGQVPWLTPPIVSPSNPAALSSGTSVTGFASKESAKDITATPGAAPRQVLGDPAGRMNAPVAGPNRAPSVYVTPAAQPVPSAARIPADRPTLGPRVDPARVYDGPRAAPPVVREVAPKEAPRDIAPARSESPAKSDGGSHNSGKSDSNNAKK